MITYWAKSIRSNPLVKNVSPARRPRRHAGLVPVSVGAAVCQIGEQVANSRSDSDVRLHRPPASGRPGRALRL